MGADEFLKGKKRFCLWLGDCEPDVLAGLPECRKRVEAVREYRAKSSRAATKRLAGTPTRFQTENMPKSDYLLIPKVSSERREYIPIGFLSPETMCSDLVMLMPDASLFHFGVLTSSVHMAWMRTVAGRLKSDYRYSKDVVYNCFPWPDVTDRQRASIEEKARGVLDARAAHPASTMANLYDPDTMPADLRKAHEALDRAVMAAYGCERNAKLGRERAFAEAEMVADLMRRYVAMTEGA